MIEFKAECGHTVRARSEDAGSMARCSYCGRSVKVPDDSERDLEALFREAEQGPAVAEVMPPRRRRRRWSGLQLRGRGGEFDPFPLIFRLVYAAILVTVVVVLYQKVVKQWLVDKPPNQAVSRTARNEEAKGRHDAAARRSAGLTSGALSNGLYVRSVPAGATVFCIESNRAPAKGRIQRIKGCQQFNTLDTNNLSVSEGTYVVEVAFPINDPRLKGYKGYTEFRRAVESGSDGQRRELVDAYFLPDEAVDVFVADSDEQTFLVRQYREVDVRSGVARAVRALFLPRISEGDAYSIRELVSRCLSSEPKLYAFDEGNVLSELAYYEVPEGDRRAVMDALSRTGIIPYVGADGEVRLFRIGVQDGLFSAKLIRQ